MSYWDTACLVKLYVPEPDSPLFAGHAAALVTRPATGGFARLELWTALRRKEAEASLAPGEAKQVLGVFDQNVADSLVRHIPLHPRITAEFERVVETCLGRTPPLFIRTLDALHLASAITAGETELVTTDKRLREAALLLGLVIFPPPAP